MYRRHLPHWQKPDAAIFLTWRLFGSLPKKTLLASRAELTPGKKFLILDRELDKGSYGPTWLEAPPIADLIVSSLNFGMEVRDFYRLSAFVVMSNHVHILIWPNVRLERITKFLKGYTAREANKILNRTGNSFWQDESFDHAVRNAEEFDRIRRYIEMNPVKARLIKEPKEWRWSSAAKVPRQRINGDD